MGRTCLAVDEAGATGPACDSTPIQQHRPAFRREHRTNSISPIRARGVETGKQRTESRSLPQCPRRATTAAIAVIVY